MYYLQGWAGVAAVLAGAVAVAGNLDLGQLGDGDDGDDGVESDAEIKLVSK